MGCLAGASADEATDRQLLGDTVDLVVEEVSPRLSPFFAAADDVPVCLVRSRDVRVFRYG